MSKKNNNRQAKYIVIDTSIARNVEAIYIINEAIKSGNKIVITTIIEKELEKLTNDDNSSGENAKYILHMEKKNKESFIRVGWNGKKEETLDDAVIRYCKDKENTVLWSSDKDQIKKAKACGIETRFIKAKKRWKNLEPGENEEFPYADYIDEKFILNMDEYREGEFMELISDGSSFYIGKHQLEVGDEILLGKKKYKHILILHYKFIDTGDSEIILLIKENKVKKKAEIRNLDNCYIEFAKDLFKRFDNR